LSWTIADIQQATAGELLVPPPAVVFDQVAIDSRQIGPDQVFVAIRGENHDGHEFIDDVVANGCRGVVVQADQLDDYKCEQLRSAGVAVIGVDDTIRALGALAAYHRRRMPARIVALTGSNGKTTTRAMTASVLSRRFETLATQGNLNNEIGVPLTLFGLAPHHEMGVIEMGMNHAGEIDRLGRIATPDFGMITNVAPAHLEGLQTVQGVRDAKGELLDHVAPDGRVILNADDPLVRELAARSRAEIVFYGQAHDAHVRAEAIEATAAGTRFILRLPHASGPIQLKVPGAFMVANALAASAAGYILGVDLADIQAGLATVQPVAGRMQIQRLADDITIINDCYNANPASTAAAIKTLTALKGTARGILVLGDMLELGREAAALHRLTGERAGSADLERLYVHGPHAEAVAAGARSAGMVAERILTGPVPDICDDLTARLQTGDWVLIKGSRGMRMERVVEALTTWADRGAEDEQR
jgi:UDP-N-acetylmuramoyl-tripeptide--D-alanyl-D-alanine ligase